MISYQGQVTVGGTPYDGTGYFKFAVVNAAGTTTYWSNNGTSIGGGEPNRAVPLTVTDGLFNVLLGDTTLTNMTVPLSAAVFDGPDRYLRVWFSENNIAYELLSPDRRIAAMPYALQAQEAAYAAYADYAAYASDADRLDGQQAGSFQLRVSGTCAVGSTVRRINPDGSVTCQADALNRALAPTANVSTTLDSRGWYTSVTIGTDGLPLISYYGSYDDLKVAHCEDLACTSATLTTLDSAGNVGAYTSVTIGADGLGLISYSDVTNSALKVAHCNNLLCTSATTSTLTGDGPRHTSVTIGADGLPLISYANDGDDLQVVHCEDPACTSCTGANLANVGAYGGYTSLAIGADGLGLISYWDAVIGGLAVAHCDDVACTSATVTTLCTGYYSGGYTSVAIGADGRPLISICAMEDIHDAPALRVYRCNYLECTSAGPIFGDNWGETVYECGSTSVTSGADGLPLVSYYDADGDGFGPGTLKVIRCWGENCTLSYAITVDSAEHDNVGEHNAVTIGADGLPLISYWDSTPGGGLKVLHCGSAFCTPYFRRR